MTIIRIPPGQNYAEYRVPCVHISTMHHPDIRSLWAMDRDEDLTTVILYPNESRTIYRGRCPKCSKEYEAHVVDENNSS
jgi:hypothetical protein